MEGVPSGGLSLEQVLMLGMCGVASCCLVNRDWRPCLCYEVGQRAVGGTDEVLWGKAELQAAHPGTAVDIVVVHHALVKPCRQGLLHAYGRTAATDVARQWQQLPHVYHLHFLVSSHLGGFFQVHLFGTGNDTDEEAQLLAPQDEGLEQPLDGLAQLLGNVLRAEVVLIHLVCNEFVGHFQLVQ